VKLANRRDRILDIVEDGTGIAPTFGMLIQCPECLSYHTRPEPYRWYEALLWLLLIQPHRCRRCDRRFLRPRTPDLPLFLSSWRTLVSR
jgi:hypothetical protein